MAATGKSLKKEFIVPNTTPPPPPPTFAQHYIHNSRFQVTPDFINYIKSVENGIKAGFKHGLWHPHKSVEGGADTIAYGHKLQPGENFSRGITDVQATEMLKKDIQTAATRAKQITDFRFGPGAFDRLDNSKKEMLTDFAFNGVLGKFPRFLDGVVTGNDKEVKAQYIRHVNGKEMTGRNQAFANRYLKP